MMEYQVNIIIQVIGEMMNRNAKVINVKLSVEDEFMDKLKIDLKNSVWKRGNCTSWYTNSKGDITTQWPDDSTYWSKPKILIDTK